MASAVVRDPVLRRACLTVAPDAVYFLMFGGWKRELRSNRWHFAKRWSRYAPVVLVQPEQSTPARSLQTEPEHRIPNVRILTVKSSHHDHAAYERDTMVQIGQVSADMKRHGVERPLLWFYNPNLVGLYAALPAVGRVLHATENYFHFDGVSTTFLDFHRAAIAISDVVIAVSEGVAASIRSEVPAAPVGVITNGCDYEAYSHWRPEPRLVRARRGWDRVAIYAGNINNRIDFALLGSCARRHPQTMFAFYGPVQGLSVEDRREWRALLAERNVRYFGPVAPESLPDLYGAADIGLIPYKHTPMLVENGFPLKALEMCATGLPVVSTDMRPIRTLCDALVVTPSRESFLSAIGRLSRRELSEQQKNDMRRLCTERDYDRNFSAALELIEEHLSKTYSRPAGPMADVCRRIHAIHAEVGARSWRRAAGMLARLDGPRQRLSTSRIAKALTALSVVMRDEGARRILGMCFRRPGVVRSAGLFAMMKDVLRLGLLGFQVKYLTGGIGPYEITRTYDPTERRIVFRTVHLSAGRAKREERDERGVLYANETELRGVAWDHSERGQTVSLIAGNARWPIFLGRTGVYEFRAIERLLRACGGPISRAVLQIGSGTASPRMSQRLLASIDSERDTNDRNRAFVDELADLVLARKGDIGTTSVMAACLSKAYARRYPGLQHYVATASRRRGRVLHIGLGAGAAAHRFVAAGCRYVGMDPMHAVAAALRRRIQSEGYDAAAMVQGSSPDLPFADASFDHVCVADAVAWSTAAAHLMREIYRVLVPGGDATLVFPDWPERRTRRFAGFDEVRITRHGPDAYVTVRRPPDAAQ
jgi:glycosyltransferase involved in cell wall biosynthesis/SAM-dependent methyltransferase